MQSEKRVRVEDVMSTPLLMIEPDASLREAARMMRDNEINALVVTTTEKGIVTSTDVIGAVAEGRDLAELTVADVMTDKVDTVTPDLYMEQVAEMMTNYGIKHLPVVDDDYVGMISQTDVAAHLS